MAYDWDALRQTLQHFLFESPVLMTQMAQDFQYLGKNQKQADKCSRNKTKKLSVTHWNGVMNIVDTWHFHKQSKTWWQVDINYDNVYPVDIKW